LACDTGQATAAKASPQRTWQRWLIKGHSLRAYTVGLGILLLALLARGVLDFTVPGVVPFVTLFPAVILTGLFCGTAAGSAVAVLGMLAAWFFWLPPRFALTPIAGVDLANLAMFLLASTLILWTTATLRQALIRADDARTMLDTALGLGDVGTWEVDLATDVVRASDSTHTQHGMPNDNRVRLTRDWIETIHPDDREMVRNMLRQAIITGASFAAEYRVPKPDGSNGRVLSRGGVVSTGGRRRLVGTLIDITDRAAAEERLRAQEARLRVALEAGGLGTWETDIATGRSRWDARMAAMLGLAPAPTEVDRGQMAHLVHPEDRKQAARDYGTAVSSGGQYTSEIRGVTATGETRWFVSRGIVLSGPGGPQRVIGVTRDVTERRQREDALREALEAREMLVREADHRIKNGLQLVVSLLRLQRARVAAPEAAEALSGAIARVEAVAQSHQALQQSKDLQTIDFGDTLRGLCKSLGQLNPSVETRCGFEADLHLDAERAIPLALIVSELLTNAIRHAYPEGGGQVTVDAIASEEMLTVTVADQGIGLLPQVNGTGLGSTVIRSLARQIDAEVVVQSAEGKGTTIALRLPRHATVAAE
jgi:PAS domain S-box-containing protein